ncbi:MAG: cobalt-precorrin-5B (C(1))-methyltransferase CbiD [Oscillospiraceae bacterium]|jgi:cobalt-precorrin-5B (C1)-methyltransferase|nr:cobalt-precorrin-5B (C(1))-methyltransferase CbiD [Oscillospiraceae bacterium]
MGETREPFGLQSNAVIVQDGRELRRGWTTGSCAAAAAKAAALLLLTGQRSDAVRLTTPKGIELLLEVADSALTSTSARCAVRKDGGDDPDATHGLLIHAEVTHSAAFEVDGGEGVGRVTRSGLSVPVGMAAINPVPRRMIEDALRSVCAEVGHGGGLRAVISVPNGETVAARTFNPSLGIVGGISILGTSGIVEPMSERAIIDTTRLEIDALRATVARAILLTPGNYGRDFAETLGFADARSVKYSNFLGEALDYATYKGFSDILVIAHAGKLVKTAAGVFYTHSRVADGRAEVFAAHAALCGAETETVRAVFGCVTADAAVAVLRAVGLDAAVIASIAGRIDYHLKRRAAGAEFIMFSNEYGELARSNGAQAVISKLIGE